MTTFTDPFVQLLSKTGISVYQGAMQELYKSPLGTPVYSDLSIEAGSYVLNQKTVSYNAVKIPDALFSFSKRKRIVVTSIDNSEGDVFEYTGEESAQISCTVRLYGSNLNYPGDDAKNFYRMLESNQPVKISSWFINQFGINYAMITDYEIPQQKGNISDQQVKFNMREVDIVKYPTLLNK